MKNELLSCFEYVEVRSDYLMAMLERVMGLIVPQIDADTLLLGALHEGATSSGEAGEVTEAGDVYLDPSKLRKYDDDVAMAIMAHEIAHRALNHHLSGGSLDMEHEADALAKKWGFDVDKFRAICGPASEG